MSNKLKHLSEADFLKKLAVDMYNSQYGKNLNPIDFCVMSIPTDTGFRYGYEVITIKDDDFLRLRMYFNLEHTQRFKPFQIEVSNPYAERSLSDEIFITSGSLESYYLDSNIYKFREINTCDVNNLLTEDMDDITTEDDEDIILE
jgi:hypothetical protein